MKSLTLAALITVVLSFPSLADDVGNGTNPPPVVAGPPQPAAAAPANGDGMNSESIAAMVAAIESAPSEKKETLVINCRYITGDTLRRVLEGFLSPGGTVASCDESGVVVVTEMAENVENIRRIADSVDQPIPQALIEARIVELTLDSDFEKEISLAYSKLEKDLPAGSEDLVKRIGTSLSTPGANPNVQQGSIVNYQDLQGRDGDTILSVLLRYLETRGAARILSAPSLVLRQGSEGSIVTGEEVPILTQTVTSGSISTSTKFKSVGVKLRVVPIVIAGGRIRVQVSPEVSTVTGFSRAGEGVDNPIIAVRNASTELTVKSGQLVSIGGLLREEERKVERRVPILSSIPILGHLFTSTRKQKVQTQVVIFLTLTALDVESQVGPDLISPADLPKDVRDAIDRVNRRGRGDAREAIPSRSSDEDRQR